MAFKLFDRVQETSTSTGTGDITLAGAVTGFSTFASRYSTGDTLYYGIHAVNSSGVPTGEWEIGLGTYSAANTLTRTTVLSSSNSDAAVSFSSGAKRVFVTMTALQGASVREKLTANRTYYVRTDGSDSNNGLTNTSGGALLTIQKAIDIVASLDCNGYAVTIQVANGTYSSGIATKQFVGLSTLTIIGNVTTPANVLISTTGDTISWESKTVSISLSGVKLASSAGIGIMTYAGGSVKISSVDFGTCATSHLYVRGSGAAIYATGNYTISGDSPVHVYVLDQGSFSFENKTITLSGTRNFSTAYAFLRLLSLMSCGGAAFTGTATGKRYDISLNSAAYAAAVTLPGSVAGTTATGGQYA